MTLQAHRLMSRRQRSFQRRHALAIAAAAALGPLAAAPASAAVCTWDTTNGNWNAIVNWLGCVGGNGNPANTPGSNDTANIGSSGVVTIDTAQSILNLNNAGQINIDAASLTLFNGGSTVNTGVINVGSATAATLKMNNGHNINNTGGSINIATGSVLNQLGGTISGGTINTTGSGAVVAGNSANNFLDSVALNGTLDMASAYGIERVTNGLTLNGSVNIAKGSIFAPQGDQTFSGSGTIVFADGNASNRLNVEAGNLTLGSGITVRGDTGYIGQQTWVGGAATLTNNGTIQADVAGGTIRLTVNGTTVNNGTLAALNGGTLRIENNVNGAGGGQILAGAGSVVSQAGVTLSGGTINSNGGGSLRAENNGNNFLDKVTLNGTLDMASAYGVERVTNGLTLNGSVNIAKGSIFAPQGDQTIGGNGTIVFADSNASNRLNVEAGNLTLGSGITLRGETGYIGQQSWVGGAATLTNNGTIQADVAGGMISLGVNGLTINNGTLAALNGGTLRLRSDVAGTASGQILAGAGSIVSQAGVTLSGGTINSNGDGSLRAENNGNNFLDNVTLNGTLDMASAYGVERVTNGLVLNGSVNIAGGSIFAPQGDQTIGGNGTIVFADSNASNRFNVEAGNLTLGSGITVRGQTGYIGQQAWAGGAATLTNNGTINSDGGGTITLAVNGTTTNAGMMRAQDGTLAINTALVNHGTLQADADGVVKLPNGFTNDGLMTGVGKFTLATGTLNNNGHVTPGTPGGDPGALTLDGKYAQGASGWFDVGLDGASFGSLSISGSAALDGTISVICQGACDYAAGTSWIVMMTGGSNLVTGTFAGPVVMTGFSAGAFSVTYLSNQVILNVTEATVGVVPEPSTYAMTLAGLAALGWLARRRRTA